MRWRRGARLAGFALGFTLAGAAHAQWRAPLHPAGCLPERETQAHDEAVLALLHRDAMLRQGCASHVAELCALEAQVSAELRAALARPPCMGEFFVRPRGLSPRCSALEAMRRAAEVAGDRRGTALVRSAEREACMPGGSGRFPAWLQPALRERRWHYPDGRLFHQDGSADWFYPDGAQLSRGGNWYYPDRTPLHDQRDWWRTPQGIQAGMSGVRTLGCEREGGGPLCTEADARSLEHDPFWAALSLLQLLQSTR